MNITIASIGKGRFSASIGDRLLPGTSTEPFLNAARILLSEGVSPDEVLTMSHQGEARVSLRSTVGKAARLTVKETDKEGPRFTMWSPNPYASQDSPVSTRRILTDGVC